MVYIITKFTLFVNSHYVTEDSIRKYRNRNNGKVRSAVEAIIQEADEVGRKMRDDGSAQMVEINMNRDCPIKPVTVPFLSP